jgi:hypothetical protein
MSSNTKSVAKEVVIITRDFVLADEDICELHI